MGETNEASLHYPSGWLLSEGVRSLSLHRWTVLSYDDRRSTTGQTYILHRGGDAASTAAVTGNQFMPKHLHILDEKQLS